MFRLLVIAARFLRCTLLASRRKVRCDNASMRQAHLPCGRGLPCNPWVYSVLEGGRLYFLP